MFTLPSTNDVMCAESFDASSITSVFEIGLVELRFLKGRTNYCAKGTRTMPFGELEKGVKQNLISYDEALARLRYVANHTAGNARPAQILPHQQQPRPGDESVSLSLAQATGHISCHTLYALRSTPPADSSAMDGFAVNAYQTAQASEEDPVRFLITESMAAGDDPVRKPPVDLESLDKPRVCIEIMTGACFPTKRFPQLDSVVKIEDIDLEERQSPSHPTLAKYIHVKRPVKLFQHRRPAGSDFVRGELIIDSGTIVEPRHVAALASVGYTHIEVIIVADRWELCRDLTVQSSHTRIGVLSTGSELVGQTRQVDIPDFKDSNLQHLVSDSNGPYMISALQVAFPSAVIDFLGIAKDNEGALTECLSKALSGNGFDVIITSGGVSKGRHDLVRHVVETRLRGRVNFHGVKIRPGAPVLFASIGSTGEDVFTANRDQTAFFGVPGNPVAAAVALRFFVIPYISTLQSKLFGPGNDKATSKHTALPESERLVSICQDDEGAGTIPSKTHSCSSKDSTVFRLARGRAESADCVEILDDQASYKLRGLLKADCWVTLPTGFDDTRYCNRLLSTPL